MSLLLEYLVHNYLTLMILLSLTVTIIVNRRLAVPATNYFVLGILTLLLITVADTVNYQITSGVLFKNDYRLQFTIRITTTALGFILRPLVLMILSFIVIPNKKYIFLFSIPALANAVVYIFACFGTTAYDLIDETSRWHRSFFGMSVHYAEIFYLFLLLLFSIIYFKWDELKRSIIVFLIVLQFIIVTILDAFGILKDYINPVLAMGMLEYYFYLSVIYQHEMHDSIMQKELTITQHKISLLRSQMHPHFIINALSIMRSLVKRDTTKAVECIDAFADYLNVHIHAIQTDGLIDFSQELRHVNAYLSLVQADRSRQIDVRYDLEVTDFFLPPLSLEPFIENAVKYGTGKDNGVITISTKKTDGAVQITVSDNGTGNPEHNQKNKGTGIGISNTRQRLFIQCGGSLETKQSDDGMSVIITIPNNIENKVHANNEVKI